MLNIVGAPKVRVKYTNIPMHDGIGKVTAYAHWNRVAYRPKGGSIESRLVRAQMIAVWTGGIVVSSRKGKGYVVVVIL